MGAPKTSLADWCAQLIGENGGVVTELGAACLSVEQAFWMVARMPPEDLERLRAANGLDGAGAEADTGNILKGMRWVLEQALESRWYALFMERPQWRCAAGWETEGAPTDDGAAPPTPRFTAQFPDVKPELPTPSPPTEYSSWREAYLQHQARDREQLERVRYLLRKRRAEAWERRHARRVRLLPDAVITSAQACRAERIIVPEKQPQAGNGAHHRPVSRVPPRAAQRILAKLHSDRLQQRRRWR
ncbi:hypothetical protein CDCA_CDCA17G4378 [Cyanidium caldarium]|uniref:Uncharacterized protein n=1 Tax=Cyanidium caldarium TaxID=2771 RepID=A0AAV9J2S4_CYACA|nr:hypothetical protein CDCA_CDCA17G4378 [Cyanidium caldarium]|eukprot:ctg_285.g190